MPFKRPNSEFYYASAVINGKQVRRSTGTANKQQATEIEKKWRESLTVKSDSWDAVISTYLSAKPSIRAGYSIKALLPHFRGQPVNAITSKDYSRYVALRRADGISDSTIRRELGVVRTAYRYVKTHLEWNVPDFPNHVLPPKPPSRVRWLTDQEYTDLMKAARESKAKYLAPFIQLAVNTGMRKSELLDLEWKRVDIQQRLIHLTPDLQKGKRYSSVPLNAGSLAALEELANDSPHVFPVKDLKKAFAAAVKNAEVEDFRIHDLRHTCASWMIQKGASINEVAEVLRHKDIHTTMIYAHLSPEGARSAVDRLI